MIRGARLIGLTLALCLGAASFERVTLQRESAGSLVRLSDREFWDLIVQFSEPNGYFDSDNLISNEDTYQYVIPELKQRIPAGGVYLGVGPDQNFSYIVAVRPRLAFITDVRRGNLHVHLMYKALVELSADRAEFLSRLFSRPRPAGLGPQASADELFRAFRTTRPDRALYEQNLQAIADRLVRTHGFKLDPSDAPGIAHVYSNFFAAGPDLRFISSRSGNRYPTFEDLQLADDGRGAQQSYLASESRYAALRAMELANAIVPVVGNFAGPKALRAIGGYLKSSGSTVSVFYTSNVERYLFQDGIWTDFMTNVAALPLGDESTFIRSCFDSCSGPGGSRSVTMLDSMSGLLRDVRSGRVTSYSEVLFRSRGR